MASEINIYNPDELGPPMGQYTHVTRVKANEFLFIAGMLSGDSKGNIIGAGDFDKQTAQVFRNVEAALKSAGAQYAVDGRPAGAGAIFGRGADHRGDLIRRQ
jgi:enamine deaminase RidA (YjgF/YER057c/UK114 family)